MSYLDEAKKIKNYLVEQRRYFHAHPELPLKEFGTAEHIASELQKFGVPFRRVGETGVLAEIDFPKSGAEKSRAVLLRADIDALPIQEENDVPYKSQNAGVMHACGHDAHTAILLGVAKLIAEKENGGGEFSNFSKILLMFQPAEEIGDGINPFFEQKVFEGVERIYSLHLSSGLEVGKIAVRGGEIMASCDYFKIEIEGKSAHGSRPNDGIDAALVAAQIVNQLQTIVSRLISPVESGVVGVGKIVAGNAYNIIAPSAVLEGTIRAFSDENRTHIQSLVRKIANDVADIYGAKVDVSFKAYTEPCINDETAAQEEIEAASRAVGKENVVTNAPRRFGSDNFADIIKGRKGAYAFVGSNGGESSALSHHCERFNIDEDSLVYGTAFFLELL